MVMGNVQPMAPDKTRAIFSDVFDGALTPALLQRGDEISSKPNYQGDPAGTIIISSALRPNAEAVTLGVKVGDSRSNARGKGHDGISYG